jgi:pimeloyl-ACP methyl ester carboxylesterase
MVALAANGYRAIAPDLRGYGDTDVPADLPAYTVFHIVGDLLGLLDHLELPRVSLALFASVRKIIKHFACTQLVIAANIL